ncbi:MAG: hypothetical protein ACK52V_16150 [Betaproteobacteria bacterium]|jgi:hypothetical protein
MAGFSTGGGGLSGGSSGPAEANSRSSSAYDSAFNVTFGGGKTAQLAPWIALAVVALAWIVTQRKR